MNRPDDAVVCDERPIAWRGHCLRSAGLDPFTHHCDLIGSGAWLLVLGRHAAFGEPLEKE